MANRPYQRLPGRGSRLLSISALWEADDHLLLVDSYRVSESYKRFFYRDIQAIIICQTNRGLITSSILAAVALLVGVAALAASSHDSLAASILGVFAGLFFLCALIGYLRGPTCRCTLRTAVQTHPLPSLHRIRTARKVLLRIQPKISEAQKEPPPQ